MNSEQQKQFDDNVAKLPEKCFVKNLTTGDTVVVIRGEMGHRPHFDKNLDVNAGNQVLGVTKQQAGAMYMGSLCGFHAPAADIDRFDENGELKR